MLTQYRHGALYVIEDLPARNEIQRALKKIDQRLFIERQMTLDQQVVWCVVVDVGGDQAPVTILEWRDQQGQPIDHLSSGLIDRVAAMERDGKKLTDRVIEANARFVEAGQRRTREAYSELALDLVPRINDRIRPVLPRSQALRMSRDKLRSMGVKV